MAARRSKKAPRPRKRVGFRSTRRAELAKKEQEKKLLEKIDIAESMVPGTLIRVRDGNESVMKIDTLTWWGNKPKRVRAKWSGETRHYELAANSDLTLYRHPSFAKKSYQKRLQAAEEVISKAFSWLSSPPKVAALAIYLGPCHVESISKHDPRASVVLKRAWAVSINGSIFVVDGAFLSACQAC